MFVVPSDPNEFEIRNKEVQTKAEEIARQYGYSLDVSTSQRTLTCIQMEAPPHGTEIFVTKIPRQMFEDELFPYFASVGRIYKHRLMMSPSGISNRGCAYITYENSTAAKMAIMNFHDKDIVRGCKLSVRQSVDNRRLFIGGIPEHKTKTQVWEELIRVGMEQIVEVIMYRSYIDRNKNRGFVFVEFSTHEDAALVRVNYKHAILFGNRVQVDWSAPLPSVDEFTMQRVKKLFLRNLPVALSRTDFAENVIEIIGSSIPLEKVYKCKDYAFLHFCTRRDAQRGMSLLKNHFQNTDVEVTWAKPIQKQKNQGRYSPPKNPSAPLRSGSPAVAAHSPTSLYPPITSFSLDAAREDFFEPTEINNNNNNIFINDQNTNELPEPRPFSLFDFEFDHMELINSVLGNLQI